MEKLFRRNSLDSVPKIYKSPGNVRHDFIIKKPQNFLMTNIFAIQIENYKECLPNKKALSKIYFFMHDLDDLNDEVKESNLTLKTLYERHYTLS
jgi:hypothetical protein